MTRQDILFPSNSPNILYPKNVSLMYFQWNGISGGNLDNKHDSSQYFGYKANQNPAVLGDRIGCKFLLDKGTYTLRLIGERSNNRAIARYRLNGANYFDVDWYSASITRNIIIQDTFTLVNPMVCEFTQEVIGRNASSTGFFVILTGLFICPEIF